MAKAKRPNPFAKAAKKGKGKEPDTDDMKRMMKARKMPPRGMMG